MIVQMLLPINGIPKVILTIFWGGVLVNFAIRYRQKYQWQWQGLTSLNLLKAIGVFSVGLFGLVPFVMSVGYRFIDDKEWIPDYSWKIIPEAVRVFSALSISTSPIVTLCLIPFVWLIFYTLVMLKIAYLSEGKFLEDCQVKDISVSHHPQKMAELSGVKKSKSWIGTMDNFLTLRPFILQKNIDSVSIEFYKISSQDLQQNFAVLCMFLVFFLFSLYGLVQIVVFGLPAYMETTQPENFPLILLVWGFQVLTFSVFCFVIWYRVMRILFVKRVCHFTVDKLVVGDLIFGGYRKRFSISQTDLLPLQERRAKTTIPEVRNATLQIYHQGKYKELAGQLLPEAMEIIQAVYKRYCTSTFNRFYCETQPVYLK